MSISIELAGKKYKTQAGPMQSLGVLVDQVCEQLGNRFDRTSCTLMYNKQQLDLNTPIRFANLPKGSVLKLSSELYSPFVIHYLFADAPDAPRLGFQAAAGPQHNAPSESAPKAPALEGSAAMPLQQVERLGKAEVAPSVIARRMHVFGRECLRMHSGGADVGQDTPDDFYEITAQDLHRELAAQQRRHAHASAGLRSSKLRTQEVVSAANAIGHATIRVIVLDSLIVQCDFEPLEHVQALVQFVQEEVVNSTFKHAVALYISPPRLKLAGKLTSQTFWSAGMVPGAYVHLSIELAAEGSPPPVLEDVVKASVLAAREEQAPEPKAAHTGHGDAGQGQGGEGGRSVGVVDPEHFKVSESAKVASSGKKVPKWFKMRT